MKTIKLFMAVIFIAGLAAYAADELTVTTGWQYSKNGRSRTLSATGSRFNVSGDGAVDNVQLISTNTFGDALDMGGITSQGYFYAKNIGPTTAYSSNYPTTSTNSIEIGFTDNTNFYAVISLNTNQIASCWLGTGTLKARATGTNSVRLDYSITDR